MSPTAFFAALASFGMSAGCIGVQMEMRRASSGTVRDLRSGQPVANAKVAIQTSSDYYHGCGTKVIDEYEVTTDARGGWFAPSSHGIGWVWLAPHGFPGYCQRYRVVHHSDVPALGPLAADNSAERVQSRTLQLKAWEFPSSRPYVRMIAGIAGSTDQGASAQLGAVVLFEQSWFDLGLRAAVEPGLWGGAALLGLRGGRLFQLDLSAKLLRVWGRGEAGWRIGPELGIDLFVFRLSGGALRKLEGTLGGNDWIAFVALGWNLLL